MVRDPLQDQALVLLAAAFPLQQRGASGVLKHLPDALVGLGRALEVLVCANLLADLLTLFGRLRSATESRSLAREEGERRGGAATAEPRLRAETKDISLGMAMAPSTHLLRGDGLLAGLAELLDGLVVVAQILLAANEDDGEALAKVKNLGDPL